MPTLAELRDDLVNLITTTEAPAHPHLPQRLTPPVKVLEPADPYITDEPDALAFGEVRVSYDVYLIVRPGTPEKVTSELDAMIQATFAVFEDALVMPDQSSYLATRVRVSTDTRLT